MSEGNSVIPEKLVLTKVGSEERGEGIRGERRKTGSPVREYMERVMLGLQIKKSELSYNIRQICPCRSKLGIYQVFTCILNNGLMAHYPLKMCHSERM